MLALFGAPVWPMGRASGERTTAMAEIVGIPFAGFFWYAGLRGFITALDLTMRGSATTGTVTSIVRDSVLEPTPGWSRGGWRRPFMPIRRSNSSRWEVSRDNVLAWPLRQTPSVASKASCGQTWMKGGSGTSGLG